MALYGSYCIYRDFVITFVIPNWWIPGIKTHPKIDPCHSRFYCVLWLHFLYLFTNIIAYIAYGIYTVNTSYIHIYYIWTKTPCFQPAPWGLAHSSFASLRSAPVPFRHEKGPAAEEMQLPRLAGDCYQPEWVCRAVETVMDFKVDEIFMGDPYQNHVTWSNQDLWGKQFPGNTYLTNIWFYHLFDHFGLWFEAWICIKLTRVSFAVSGE